jgi:hypothetical protein
MDGDEELHFHIQGPVDLKNFTAVLHDDVPAVCGLRFVRVRNHAKREPPQVPHMSAGHMGHGSEHAIDTWNPCTACSVLHNP